MFGFGNHTSSSESNDLSAAETFIRQETALYRHYSIDEVQACVQQFTGVSLNDEQAVNLVQSIRHGQGLGAIEDYNLPGYSDLDDNLPAE